jgi:hypothetical protein
MCADSKISFFFINEYDKFTGLAICIRNQRSVGNNAAASPGEKIIAYGK